MRLIAWITRDCSVQSTWESVRTWSWCYYNSWISTMKWKLDWLCPFCIFFLCPVVFHWWLWRFSLAPQFFMTFVICLQMSLQYQKQAGWGGCLHHSRICKTSIVPSRHIRGTLQTLVWLKKPLFSCSFVWLKKHLSSCSFLPLTSMTFLIVNCQGWLGFNMYWGEWLRTICIQNDDLWSTVPMLNLDMNMTLSCKIVTLNFGNVRKQREQNLKFCLKIVA